MKREQRHELWQATAQCLLSGLGLALLVCHRFHVNPTTVALLYLIVIVLVSLGGLLVPSALVANGLENLSPDGVPILFADGHIRNRPAATIYFTLPAMR